MGLTMQLYTGRSFPHQTVGTRWSGAWSCLFMVIWSYGHAHTDLMLVGTSSYIMIVRSLAYIPWYIVMLYHDVPLTPNVYH